MKRRGTVSSAIKKKLKRKGPSLLLLLHMWGRNRPLHYLLGGNGEGGNTSSSSQIFSSWSGTIWSEGRGRVRKPTLYLGELSLPFLGPQEKRKEKRGGNLFQGGGGGASLGEKRKEGGVLLCETQESVPGFKGGGKGNSPMIKLFFI